MMNQKLFPAPSLYAVSIENSQPFMITIYEIIL